MSAEIVFWIAAAVPAYVYVGYPLLLLLLGAVRHRAVRKAPIEPTVSVLVPAYNEEHVIADKIRNVLALDYPADRLELAVACDGSTDWTDQIALSMTDGTRVRAFIYEQNRGKLQVLNDTVPQLKGEIVVFSDAASMLEPRSVRNLVAHFADPEVGAVSGVYKVRKTDGTYLGGQEDFYWKYETFIKKQEAALGSVLGAHGSLYAIRRSLYPYPAAGTINDDYVIPLRIVQRGFRVTYEPGAVAVEEATEMGGFTRRVRVMTGNIEQLRELVPLLWPPRPMPLFFFLSHKLGRLLVPPALIALAISNVLLLHSPAYRVFGALQLGFYLLVLLGAVWQVRPRVLRLPYYFCMINAAAVVGMWRVAFRRRKLVWGRG